MEQAAYQACMQAAYQACMQAAAQTTRCGTAGTGTAMVKANAQAKPKGRDGWRSKPGSIGAKSMYQSRQRSMPPRPRTCCSGPARPRRPSCRPRRCRRGPVGPTGRSTYRTARSRSRTRPGDVDRGSHRIASINQHPISHSTATAQSQHSHSTVTAQSQSPDRKHQSASDQRRC